ncbi:PREDICTED: serine-rich adhesin for platelets isoform X2 [Dinoponera quadriceps]|uniref:Serine-rich adhesin for platelets isoform X2 n=1 Tax=Dinoponera quadriceps TaxID=609295 RepID=A0A6P3XJ02_DINQU|nr:PREDICTED: serine-rich adhesin for platelets isoform X2 [Dinoponera quadriceps]
MEQFEQLLTCAICLDRYRNPKLLPCQHSFCMEPCMDGLVDYVRRQVKCPECRAEHRIPYQGVQAFPTNVTLQRFLELHIEITGELPDPTSGQTMERCGVCSEKSYCALCVHCEKKCCPECKDAHMDILRREITRINSQVRRGLHRLQDALALVEKNTLGLQTNCASVAEEVDEIYRRLSKALKDRTEHLRNEVDRYLGAELRGLIQLKENLELEIANIQSNCDLAEAHINENVPWDDAELLDTKELFLRTVEFIRNFEYEAGDYSRRVRFVMAHDPNQLVLHVAGYGELNIKPESGSGGLLGSSSCLAPPGGSPGLMRSKSDHRLASQYRQQEEERLARNRYVPEYEYDAPEYEVPRNKSRYRSRFMRHRDGDDSDGDSRSTVRFTSSREEPSALRERVLDTEDAARGPLSGIFRLTDSPRVMKKLQECERAGKRKKEEPASQQTVVQQPQPPKPQVQVRKVPSAMARQTSEDDEISRIKKQNKNAAAATHTDTVEERQPTAPAPPVHPPPRELPEREVEEPVRRPAIARRTSAETHAPPAARSASSDSSTGSESSTGSGIRNTGAPFTAEEMKQKYLSRAPPTNTTTTLSTGPSVTSTTGRESNISAATTRPFQSRFLGAGNRAAPPPPIQTPREEPAPKKKEEEEDDDEETSSSSEETESDTEESETDVHPPNAVPSSTSSVPQDRQRNESAMARTDIGPLLARSAEARRGSKEDSPSTRYSSPRGSPAHSVTSPTMTTMTSPGGGGGGGIGGGVGVGVATSTATPGGYTSRTFSDGTDVRSAGRVEDDIVIAATTTTTTTITATTTTTTTTTTIADYAFNADYGDALRQVIPPPTNTTPQTDGITDTDNKSTTSSSSHLAISPESLMEGSRGSRVASVAEDDALVDGRSGNDEVSLVSGRDRHESVATDDDSATRTRDTVMPEKRESEDTPVRAPLEDDVRNASVVERSASDLSSLSAETIDQSRGRSKSKDSRGVSESSSSVSGRTMSDSESESDSESDSEDEEVEEDDESRDENCNLKKEKKEERGDSDDASDTESEDSSSSSDTDGEATVLSVSSNTRADSSLTQSDDVRYERDLKRRSASIIDERSIEEMFDDNGWVITEQDLQADVRTVSGFGSASDPIDRPADQRQTEDTAGDEPSDAAGTRPEDELIPKIAESGLDVKIAPSSEQRAPEETLLPRSRVYRQSSLGKNGWLVSDESESESDRATSPTEAPSDVVDAKIGGVAGPIEGEVVRETGGGNIDDNGWVILEGGNDEDDEDDDEDDDVVGEDAGDRSAESTTSATRSQTTDLVTKSNIENGALLANATQSKGTESPGEHEGTPGTNISIPMQMDASRICGEKCDASVDADGCTRPWSWDRIRSMAVSFLNKSRSQAAMMASRERERERDRERERERDAEVDMDSPLSTRSRYAALKERRQRLARSRSSHNFGGDDLDLDEEPPSPTTQSPNAYLAAKYGAGSELARSRSTHALKSREPSPERDRPGTEKDGAALSSWARYLKNKYGNRTTKDKEPPSSSSTIPSSRMTQCPQHQLGLKEAVVGLTSQAYRPNVLRIF